MYYYQHNKVYITWDSYKYVYEYKKQLLNNITNLLKDNNIRFVICYGNLLEYERKQPIYRDDDLDIVFCNDDIKKWENFCNNNDKIVKKYNLVFDERFKDIKRQKFNGIQCRLLKFENQLSQNLKINEYKMDIHCDLVSNYVESKFWKDLDIDYSKTREIVLYGVKTFAPSIFDTTIILLTEYGPDFIIPNTPNPFK